MRERPRRVLRAVLLVLALAALATTAGATARRAHADSPLPLAITHQTFNAATPLANQDADGAIPESAFKNPPNPICSTATTNDPNVNTDCEGINPHNETAVAVNPKNPLNIIESANDYQIAFKPSGQSNETIFDRAHITFDGGKTWTEVAVPNNGYTATGDPGLAFDAAGNAYMSSLGFGFGQGSPGFKNADILVAHSPDGGRTWSDNIKVAAGSGSAGSVGTFNDKEAIAAWGNGNVIVTWSLFTDKQKGAYGGSPIVDSVSHDGGQTWSAPQIISGTTASFCAGFSSPNACDQNQGSVPVIGPGGSIYVSFLSERDNSNGRDNYLVVKVDPTTGARSSGPFLVAPLMDGATDYPLNAFGEQTYQDSQFRTWSFGNVAADPTHVGHVAVAWSDMRNSELPAPSDPYSAKTNSDVSVAQSFDGGQTWSVVTLKAPGDQFFPWAAYDGSGKLRIGYNDRSYDSANHKLGYTLATETRWGSLQFSTKQVTTVLSDPTQNDRWFSSFTANPAFPHPSSFLGDYTMIAVIPDGGVAATWADMRNNVCINGRCGAGEDAYYATVR